MDSHVGDLAWTEGTDQGCAIEPEKGLWLKTYAYATEPGKGDEANLCFLGLIMTANLIPTFLLEMRCFNLKSFPSDIEEDCAVGFPLLRL